jgi:hypothetical protein
MKLEQNYPNPFNPTTRIKYTVPASLNRSKRGTLITLKIYDVLCKEILTLVNEVQPAGEYEVIFDAKRLPSGIYYYRLQTGYFIQTREMLLLK